MHTKKMPTTRGAVGNKRQRNFTPNQLKNQPVHHHAGFRDSHEIAERGLNFQGSDHHAGRKRGVEMNGTLSFQELQAALKKHGHVLQLVRDTKGGIYYVAHRWGMSRTFSNLTEAQAFLQQVGGAKHA